MSVYKKLTEARVMLHDMELKKSGLNSYSKYQYFELCDFIKPIQNIFKQVGLCGVVSFTNESATLTIVDADDGSQSIVISSPMVTAELKGANAIQGLGASHTYLRRYLWVMAMEIVENDVVDSNGAAEKKVESRPNHGNKLNENPAPTVNPQDSAKIKDEFKWKIEISQSLEELAKLMVDISNTKKYLTQNDATFLRDECRKKKSKFESPSPMIRDLTEKFMMDDGQ